jgi:hypothetical protein
MQLFAQGGTIDFGGHDRYVKHENVFGTQRAIHVYTFTKRRQSV